MSKQTKRVLVMGAGAIGGYFGARLQQSGAAGVTLAARGDHYELIKYNGLRLTTPEDDTYIPVAVTDEPYELTDIPDLILMTVKTKDTAGALEQIRPLAEKGATVLTLQNGLGNYDYLREQLGEERVLRGFCRVGAEKIAAGHIEFRSMGDITFGEEDGAESERCRWIKALFDRADVTCTIAPDILKQSWRKMIWNTVFNCITGLTATTMDAIFSEDSARQLARDLAEELNRIAGTQGVHFSEEELDKVIFKSERLGAFKTSTYQDRMKGNAMEYEAFTGYACKQAELTGVRADKLNTVDALLRLTEYSHRY